MRFVLSSPMGFDKEHLDNVRIGPPAQDMASRQANAIRQELLRQPMISAATFASGIPGTQMPYSRFKLTEPNSSTNETEEHEMNVVFGVDKHYTETLGLTISTGEDFTNVYSTDSTGGFLLNQAAVKALNFTEEEALGKMMEWEGGGYSGTIVGVVENFHFKSLHHEVEPLVIPLLPRYSNGQILVRIKAGNPRDAIQQIETIWNKFMPGHLFDYSFLDDVFGTLYQSESRMGKVVSSFTILALFLACLGLFGLTALMIGQRGKEISIRKVLGQSAHRSHLCSRMNLRNWYLWRF